MNEDLDGEEQQHHEDQEADEGPDHGRATLVAARRQPTIVAISTSMRSGRCN